MSAIRPPPTVVLGVDQAAVSGWAIRLVQDRTIVALGVAETWRERDAAIQAALKLAAGDVEAIFVQLEDHRGFKDWLVERGRGKVAAWGLSGALARWQDALDRVGHPESLRGFATPLEWRRRVHGAAGGGSDACKRRSLAYARSRLGLGAFDPLDHNAAEALGLSDYGALWGIGQLLGRRQEKRVRRRAAAQRARQLPLKETR